MSAKYNCNICGRRLLNHYNVRKEHEFISGNVRVQFIVDFNQWTENDICASCALKAIKMATDKLMRL